MDVAYSWEIHWGCNLVTKSASLQSSPSALNSNTLPDSISLCLRQKAPKNKFWQQTQHVTPKSQQLARQSFFCPELLLCPCLSCMPRTSTIEKHVSASSSHCCEENGQVPAVPLGLLPNTTKYRLDYTLVIAAPCLSRVSFVEYITKVLSKHLRTLSVKSNPTELCAWSSFGFFPRRIIQEHNTKRVKLWMSKLVKYSNFFHLHPLQRL